MSKILCSSGKCILATLALAVVVPINVWSQELEEITVTARRREESLQEVPLSITAFTATDIQSMGLTNNYNVAQMTVNFNTVQQVGRRLDRPVIRGQTAAATGGEPNASYFIDGAFVSGSISTATLGPIERVEILRGPQSTQFGRATFSGAVNYVTRQPSNEFEGEIQTRVQTNDSILASGWASGPIIKDKLLFFGSIGYDQYGGEWNNDLKQDQANPTAGYVFVPQDGDSSDLGGTKTTDLVGKLLWMPTDDSTFTFKLGYTKGDDDHYPQLIQEPGELNCYIPQSSDNDFNLHPSSGGAFCGTADVDAVHYIPWNPFSDLSTRPAGVPQDGGARQNRFNLPDFYQGVALPDFSDSPFFGRGTEPEDWVALPEEPGTRRDQYRVLLQYDQGFAGDWNLTARAAWNKDELQQAFDLDHTESRFFGNTFNMYADNTREDTSLEARIDSSGDKRLRGSVGLYWFDREDKERQKRFVGDGFGRLTDPTIRTIENTAIFGSIEYDVGNKWTLSAEARYANDTKKIKSPPRLSCDEPGREDIRITDETDVDSLTPRFTVRYQATDDAMIYLQAAKGTNPADFNSAFYRSTADACETLDEIPNPDSRTRFDEEQAWTYEAGAKTMWLDGRITANLAMFYIDWENQRVFETEDVGGIPTSTTRNAGRSRVYGLELETSFFISERWSAGFAYGLANGKYKKYSSEFFGRTTTHLTPDEIDANPEQLKIDGNVEGHKIPENPKHSIVTNLAYNRPINADLGWFFRTDFIWESKRYISSDNFMQIDDRLVWNGRIGLDSGRWTLTTYVNNILDRQTPASINNFPYVQCTDYGLDLPQSAGCRNNVGTRWPNGNMVEGWALTPTPGRQWGAELIWRFGQ